jgi:hypothetical protein
MKLLIMSHVVVETFEEIPLANQIIHKVFQQKLSPRRI